jgi:hypothetical protein
MADHFDRDPRDPLDAGYLEAKRLRFAAERIADHAERELLLLERAAHTTDHEIARELEYEAGTAHRDSIALTEEHGLDNF